MISIPRWRVEHTDLYTRVVCRACEVRIWSADHYLETRFAPDVVIPATPNYDPHSVALAAELGYGDTWALSLAHELAHTFVSEALGQDFSPTLYGVGVGKFAPRRVYRDEEQTVLAFQRLVQCNTYSPALDALNGGHAQLAEAFRALLAEVAA